MLRSCSALLILTSLIVPIAAHAQDKPAGVVEFNEFAAKPLEGWVWDKDERLEDLILQLQEKELSLQALDTSIAKALGRRAGAKMDENIAWRSNNRMDLNAGGPIRWDAFYGRNAEAFFYHPTDRNSSYHTITALQQVAPTSAGTIAGNQGTPPHQRPPQFDYIYRGYADKQKKAQADARAFANKIAEMTSRRRQLEEEVVLLWFKVAFRVFDRDKIPERAILRWDLVPAKDGNKADADRAVALNQAKRLLATALLFNEVRVESEPDTAFRTVSSVIQDQRKSFEDGLMQAGTLMEESEDSGKPIGQFKLLTRKLEDTAKTISEGYVGWKDGDRADDEPSKFTGLRRVQDSVVRYSKICLALNELIDAMKKEWSLEIHKGGTEFVPTWGRATTPRPIAVAVPVRDTRSGISLFNGSNLDGWDYLGNRSQVGRAWSVMAGGVLQCSGADDAPLISDQKYKNFTLNLEWRFPPGVTPTQDGMGLAIRVDSREQVFRKQLRFQLQDRPQSHLWALGQGVPPNALLGKVISVNGNPLVKGPQVRVMPLGNWNTLTIICDDGNVLVKQNGQNTIQVSNVDAIAGYVGFVPAKTRTEIRNVVLTPK